MSRDGAFSRAQQTKNWCVGFSFPPPAYAGIHPTLYLFGFRANALNSHSPPSLPGFDPGTFAFVRAFGACGLWGPPGPPGASGTPGAFGGLRKAGLGASGNFRGLRGASGRPLGASGPNLERSGCLGGLRRQSPGLVRMSGFWAGSQALIFPGHLQGRPGQWPPRAPSRRPATTKVVGFRVTNNLVSHSKGERSLGGAPAPAPGGAAHALQTL